MGQRDNFEKRFTFHNFSEIFYCDMTRFRNTNLSVFIQCQYTRTTLRNKNMGLSLFKKHSNFRNFDEMIYCGMTKIRSTNLHVFIQCQCTRTILRNKNMGQSLLQKHSKFLIFNFYCNMSKRGTNNRKFLEDIFTQKLLNGRKLWDYMILENVLGVTVSVIYFNAS